MTAEERLEWRKNVSVELHTSNVSMDRIRQQWPLTPYGVLGLRILHSLDNEFVKDGIDKLLTQ